MKIMVIGSGGREHALSWKLAQCTQVETVFVVPGNAGTALEEKIDNVSLDISDFKALTDFVIAQNIDMTVVGPEAPLVDGIVDYFNERQLKCFGPSKQAAQLEGSKSFTKDFLARHDIPTGSYQTFTDKAAAIHYVREQGAPIVIKADGLAAGKGVIVANTLTEAEAAIEDMLAGNVFGEAGHKVVVEEFLDGEEASFIVITDGKTIVPMATSQDHKRAYDGDLGPNTGGMGAYSPAPVVTPQVHDRILKEIIEPSVEGMAKEGHPYLGFLYAGLMIMPDGSPKVIEYNCRFGDPETQPIMMRLDSSLAELCMATLSGTLGQQEIRWKSQSAIGVVLAANGYPNHYDKGDIISGLQQLDHFQTSNCKVFHAGTRMIDDNVTTNGGRVLCVTAVGDSISDAKAKAYDAVKHIDWPGMQYRTDIGFRAVARETVASE